MNHRIWTILWAGFAAAAVASHAAAQPLVPSVPGECIYQSCRVGGPCYADPAVLSADEALALLETGSEPYLPRDLAVIVALSGDPAYVDPLLAYAARRAGDEAGGPSARVFEAAAALSAARRLGLPRALFLDQALAFAERPTLAAAAMTVLAEDPSHEEYAALRAAVGDPLDYSFLSVGLNRYGASLGSLERYRERESVEDRAEYLVRAAGGRTWAQAELRALAAEHPAAVEAAIAAYPPPPVAQPGVPPPPPDPVCPRQTREERGESARAYLRAVVAAPPAVVPHPFPPDEPPD